MACVGRQDDLHPGGAVLPSKQANHLWELAVGNHCPARIEPTAVTAVMLAREK